MAPAKESSNFNIEGRVQLEQAEQRPADLTLMAYLFDARGKLLNTVEVQADGGFTLSAPLKAPESVEVVVGPASQDADLIHKSNVWSETYSANDWVAAEGKRFALRPVIWIDRWLWWLWRPIRVCVDGSISKLVHLPNGTTDTCPVSHVKVEIFDVDRESCWWPYIYRWWEILALRPVIHIPDLINGKVAVKPPFPPDPIGPVARFGETVHILGRSAPGEEASLNPQPLPPREDVLYRRVSPGEAQGFNPQPDPPGFTRVDPGSLVSFNPQPDPPGDPITFGMFSGATRLSASVSDLAAAAIMDKLSDLTLTSLIPPWSYFPLCFYSTQKVCETVTNCDGTFKCCFRWYPFHVRHGRFRFDPRPDIIIKVTQTINGVDHVIYMDPYTSTRWNVTTAHINLTLDDPSIVCGGDCSTVPDGTLVVGFSKIGPDEVWKINDADGTFTAGGYSNAAYGSSGLNINGVFSNDLTQGSPAYYYKLSYAQQTTPGVTPPDAAFVPITTPLWVLRAPKTIGADFLPYQLGPKPGGSPVAGLYEVRDTEHYWWLYSGVMETPIGVWDTTLATALLPNHTGRFVLRLEMYNSAGTRINAVNYRDDRGNGTGVEPSPVPTVVGNHFDMLVALDNEPVNYHLTTPAVNDCGVIPWSSGLTLNFHVHADQANHRVDEWRLEFAQGSASGTRHFLSEVVYPNGQSPVDVDVSGAPLHAELLTTTCAYALMLNAWRHVRYNWGFIWEGEQVYAIAVEKCNCP